MSTNKKFRIQNGVDVTGELTVNDVVIIRADGTIVAGAIADAVSSLVDEGALTGSGSSIVDSDSQIFIDVNSNTVAIASETATRISDIASLQTQIDSLGVNSDTQAEVDSLQTQIDSIVGASPETLDTLVEIVSAFEGADSDIQSLLAANSSSLSANTAAIGVETTQRIAGDVTLQQNLDAEVTRATAAELANAAAVAAEAATRGAAVSALQASQFTYSDSDGWTGNLIPSADNEYTLGSPDRVWKDLYIGPGSLYINGTKILEDNSGTITMYADAGQNLSFGATGGGNIDLNAGDESVQLKSDLVMSVGETISTVGGAPTKFGGDVDMGTHQVSNLGTPVDPSDAATKEYVDGLNAEGTVSGDKVFEDSVTIQGNLSVEGTTTTLDSQTLKVADNIIDLNSNVSTGTPVLNAGIRIMRGDEPAVQLRWNELDDRWEVYDGVTATPIAVTSTDVIAEGDDKLFFTVVRAREAVSQDIADAVAAEATARGAAIDAEIARATSAEQANAAAIAAETTAREDAVSAEETARIAGDATVQASVDAEQAARIAADLSEAQTRAAAVSDLQSQLNTVTGSDLSSIQTQLDAIVGTSPETLDTIQEVVAAFEGADSDLIGLITGNSSTITAVNQSLTQETVDRTFFDTAEATARENADDALQSAIDSLSATVSSNNAAKSSAISTETAARVAGDEGEAASREAAITAEATARVAGDATVQAAVDAETARATAAEASISSDVTAETSRATAAEQDLQNQINQVEATGATHPLFSTMGDLPDASANHGMFAHVHSEGAAYFAHAGQWVELAKSADLANLDLSSIQSQIDVILGSSPETLDTLQEIVAAFESADGDLQTLMTANGTRISSLESYLGHEVSTVVGQNLVTAATGFVEVTGEQGVGAKIFTEETPLSGTPITISSPSSNSGTLFGKATAQLGNHIWVSDPSSKKIFHYDLNGNLGADDHTYVIESTFDGFGNRMVTSNDHLYVSGSKSFHIYDTLGNLVNQSTSSVQIDPSFALNADKTHIAISDAYYHKIKVYNTGSDRSEVYQAQAQDTTANDSHIGQVINNDTNVNFCVNGNYLIVAQRDGTSPSGSDRRSIYVHDFSEGAGTDPYVLDVSSISSGDLVTQWNYQNAPTYLASVGDSVYVAGNMQGGWGWMYEFQLSTGQFIRKVIGTPYSQEIGSVENLISVGDLIYLVTDEYQSVEIRVYDHSSNGNLVTTYTGGDLEARYGNLAATMGTPAVYEDVIEVSTVLTDLDTTAQTVGDAINELHAEMADNSATSAAVQTETDARVAAVSAEETARIAGDAVNANAIVSETNARAAAVANETQARISADNALDAKIVAETAARQSTQTAQSALISTQSTALNTEISNRTSADSGLQTQIDDIVADNAARTASGATVEEVNAVQDAVDAEVVRAQLAEQANASAIVTGDAALQAQLDAIVGTSPETLDTLQEIVTAYSNADGTLQGLIDTNTGTLAALQTTIGAENVPLITPDIGETITYEVEYAGRQYYAVSDNTNVYVYDSVDPSAPVATIHVSNSADTIYTDCNSEALFINRTDHTHRVYRYEWSDLVLGITSSSKYYEPTQGHQIYAMAVSEEYIYAYERSGTDQLHKQPLSSSGSSDTVMVYNENGLSGHRLRVFGDKLYSFDHDNTDRLLVWDIRASDGYPINVHSLTSGDQQSDTVLWGQGDQYGSFEASSTLIAVGAPYDDMGGEDNSGSVYLFNPDNLNEAHTKLYPPAEYDVLNMRFGWSVAVTDTRLIVGATDSNNIVSPTSGSNGYIFIYDATNLLLPPLVVEPPAVNMGSFTQSMFEESNRLLVRSSASDQSGVYVYDLVNMDQPPVHLVEPTNNMQNGTFGSFMAISPAATVTQSITDTIIPAQGLGNSINYLESKRQELRADLEANLAAIQSNDADIASIAADVATNTANIATNAAAIVAVNNDRTAFEASVNADRQSHRDAVQADIDQVNADRTSFEASVTADRQTFEDTVNASQAQFIVDHDSDYSDFTSSVSGTFADTNLLQNEIRGRMGTGHIALPQETTSISYNKDVGDQYYTVIEGNDEFFVYTSADYVENQSVQVGLGTRVVLPSTYNAQPEGNFITRDHVIVMARVVNTSLDDREIYFLVYELATIDSSSLPIAEVHADLRNVYDFAHIRYDGGSKVLIGNVNLDSVAGSARIYDVPSLVAGNAVFIETTSEDLPTGVNYPTIGQSGYGNFAYRVDWNDTHVFVGSTSGEDKIFVYDRTDLSYVTTLQDSINTGSEIGSSFVVSNTMVVAICRQGSYYTHSNEGRMMVWDASNLNAAPVYLYDQTLARSSVYQRYSDVYNFRNSWRSLAVSDDWIVFGNRWEVFMLPKENALNNNFPYIGINTSHLMTHFTAIEAQFKGQSDYNGYDLSNVGAYQFQVNTWGSNTNKDANDYPSSIQIQNDKLIITSRNMRMSSGTSELAGTIFIHDLNNFTDLVNGVEGVSLQHPTMIEESGFSTGYKLPAVSATGTVNLSVTETFNPNDSLTAAVNYLNAKKEELLTAVEAVTGSSTLVQDLQTIESNIDFKLLAQDQRYDSDKAEQIALYDSANAEQTAIYAAANAEQSSIYDSANAAHVAYFEQYTSGETAARELADQNLQTQITTNDGDIVSLQSQIDTIVGTSPETLDTLQELVSAYENADNSLHTLVSSNNAAHEELDLFVRPIEQNFVFNPDPQGIPGLFDNANYSSSTINSENEWLVNVSGIYTGSTWHSEGQLSGGIVRYIGLSVVPNKEHKVFLTSTNRSGTLQLSVLNAGAPQLGGGNGVRIAASAVGNGSTEVTQELTFTPDRSDVILFVTAFGTGTYTLSDFYVSEGDGQPYTLETQEQGVVTAINELHSEIGNDTLSTSSQTLSGAINELKSDLDPLSNPALETAATDVVGAINELNTSVQSITGSDTQFLDDIAANQTNIAGHDSDFVDVRGRLDVIEDTSVPNLQSQIDVHSGQIATEVADRTSGDAALQSQIDNIVGTSPETLDTLQEVVSTFQNADNDLQALITGNTSIVSTHTTQIATLDNQIHAGAGLTVPNMPTEVSRWVYQDQYIVTISSSTEDVPCGHALVFDANAPLSTPTVLSPEGLGSHVGATSAMSTPRTAKIIRDKVVVGYPYSDPGNVGNAGEVYVWDLNDLSADPVALKSPSTTGAGYFGWSVTGSADHNYIIVGEYGRDWTSGYRSDSGRVYLYDLNDLTSQPIILDPTGIPSSYWSTSYTFDSLQFGRQVSVDGDYLYVTVGGYNSYGANNYNSFILMFDLTDIQAAPSYIEPPLNQWGDYNDGSYFGWYTNGVAFNDNYVAVGSSYGPYASFDNLIDRHGTVYVYAKDTDGHASGSPVYALQSPDSHGYNYFGRAVAMDDTRLYVGVYGWDGAQGSDVGKVDVFDVSDGSLITTIYAYDGNANDYFGYNLSVNGGKLVVSSHGDDDNSSGSGSLYIYDTSALSGIPIKVSESFVNMDTASLGSSDVDLTVASGAIEVKEIIIPNASLSAGINYLEGKTEELKVQVQNVNNSGALTAMSNSNRLNVVETLVSNLESADSAEQAARVAGDAGLQSQIDNLTIAASGDVSVESAARIAGDSDEAAARVAGDATVQAAVDAEVARATGVESGLQSQLDAIVGTSPETLDTLQEVVAAFEGADGDLQTLMSANASSISDLDLLVKGNGEVPLDTTATQVVPAINELHSELDAEVLRAQTAEGVEEVRALAAESVLQSNINTESSARLAGDAGLQSQIDTLSGTQTSDKSGLEVSIAAETARATGAENTLQSNIDAEATRAQTAEAANAAAVVTEKVRAEAVEAGLAADIAVETARATAAEVQLANHLGANFTDGSITVDGLATFNGGLYFGDGTGTIGFNSSVDHLQVLSDLDMMDNSVINVAAPVDSSDAANKAYVDATTQTVSDRVDAILNGAGESLDTIVEVVAAFENADSDIQSLITSNSSSVTANTNAINAEVAARQQAITDEATARANADSDLSAGLSNETSRALSAEGVLTSDLAAEVARATSAETGLASDIAAETSRATAAEGVNATAISAETTRATTVEASLAQDIADEALRAQGAEAVLTSDVSTNATAISSLQSQVAGVSTSSGSSTIEMTAEVDMKSNKVTGMADPTAAQDAATKSYVDASVATEATSRTTEDTSLQSNIDAAHARIDAILNGSSESLDTVVEVVSAFEGADSNIQNLITANASTISQNATAIATEATARANADSDETALRTAADAVLTADIAATNARTAGISVDSDSNIEMSVGIEMGQNNIKDVNDIYAARGFIDTVESNDLKVQTGTVDFEGSIVNFGSATITGSGFSTASNNAVDNHINVSTANAGEFVKWTGTDYEWTDLVSGRLATDQLQVDTGGSIAFMGPGGTLDVQDAIVMFSGSDVRMPTPTDAGQGANKGYVDDADSDLNASLSTAISNEESRATTAEGVLTTNLSNEISRATSAEATLASDISAEETRALAAEAAEASARTDADSDLQSAIDAEVARATAAEGVNAQAIVDETSSRTSADTTLQSNIDTVSGRVDAILNGSSESLDTIVEVVAAFENADSDLQTLISSNAGSHTANAAAITAEETRALAAEGVLQSAVNAEETRATGVESGLQSQITSETAARSAADQSMKDDVDSDIAAEAALRSAGDATLQSAVDVEVARATAAEGVLQSSLDSEQSARLASDQALQSAVTAEENARVAADAVLQSAIDAEVSARTSADNTLQSNIDAIDAAVTAITNGSPETLNQLVEVVAAFEDADSDIQTLISTLGGDASALTTRVSTLESEMDATETATSSNASAISAETSARVAAVQANADAITAEATARAAAITAEQNARSAAIVASESDRDSADADLQSQIDALSAEETAGKSSLQFQLTQEELARIAGDSDLTDSLAAEVARATAAESGLSSDIVAETSRATTAESSLQTQIDSILSNTDATALNSLAEIVTEFQSVDGTLTGLISSNGSRISALETGVTAIEGWSTDNLSEGTINKYWTEQRTKDCLTGGLCISYNSTTGEISIDETEAATSLTVAESHDANALGGEAPSHYRINVYDAAGNLVN